MDHGTDSATFVDGMPVNNRTHAHGQGYSDLNFLIPETVGELTYRKGTYYADVGDFSSAGSVQLKLADTVPRGFGELTVGDYGYARGLLLNSSKLGDGDLLYAGEVQTYNGPWTNLNEDVGKASVLLRYTAPLWGGLGHATVMGYKNEWNSPDQIPQRAVDQGLIDPFGSLLQPTGSGVAQTYSCPSSGAARPNPGSYTNISIGCNTDFQPGIYVISGRIDFSNNKTVTGTNVLFVMTSANNIANVNSNTNISLSGITSATLQSVYGYSSNLANKLAGMLFWDPLSTDQIKFNGSSTSLLNGTIYTPNRALWFNGTSAVSGQCVMLVARTLKLDGSTNLNSFCTPTGSVTPDVRPETTTTTAPTPASITLVL